MVMVLAPHTLSVPMYKRAPAHLWVGLRELTLIAVEGALFNYVEPKRPCLMVGTSCFLRFCKLGTITHALT
jgi:hypothetical protein